MDLSGARWFKSSRSGGGDNSACVEVAFLGNEAGPVTAVRDTKQLGQGPVLLFPAADWHSFTTAAKSAALAA